MSIRLTVLLVSFCLGLSGALVGSILFTAMIGEVNRKRRDGETFSYFGFDFGKTLDVLSAYRTSYPGGRLRIYWILACAVTFVGFLGCCLAFGVLR